MGFLPLPVVGPILAASGSLVRAPGRVDPQDRAGDGHRTPAAVQETTPNPNPEKQGEGCRRPGGAWDDDQARDGWRTQNGSGVWIHLPCKIFLCLPINWSPASEGCQCTTRTQGHKVFWKLKECARVDSATDRWTTGKRIGFLVARPTLRPSSFAGGVMPRIRSLLHA